MAKAWPAAVDLSPGDRVAVSSAARRGHRSEEARLAPATLQYVDALHNARAQARRWQRLMLLGGAAVLVLAVIDSFFATPRAVAVSWLLVVLCAVEIVWWPRAQDRLLSKADRTAESARDALGRQHVDDA